MMLLLALHNFTNGLFRFFAQKCGLTVNNLHWCFWSNGTMHQMFRVLLLWILLLAENALCWAQTNKWALIYTFNQKVLILKLNLALIPNRTVFSDMYAINLSYKSTLLPNPKQLATCVLLFFPSLPNRINSVTCHVSRFIKRQLGSKV